MKKNNRAEAILKLLGKTVKAEEKKIQKNGTKAPKSRIKIEPKLPTTVEREDESVASEKTDLEKSLIRVASEKPLISSEKKKKGVSGVTVYLYPSELKKLDDMVLYLVNSGNVDNAYYTYVLRQAILKHEPGDWILNKSNESKEDAPEGKTITLYDDELDKLNQYVVYFMKQRRINEAKHSIIIRRMLQNLEPGEWLNN